MLDDNAGLDSRMRVRYRAQYRGPPVAIVDRSGTYSPSHALLLIILCLSSVVQDHSWLLLRGNDATE